MMAKSVPTIANYDYSLHLRIFANLHRLLCSELVLPKLLTEGMGLNSGKGLVLLHKSSGDGRDGLLLLLKKYMAVNSCSYMEEESEKRGRLRRMGSSLLFYRLNKKIYP